MASTSHVAVSAQLASAGATGFSRVRARGVGLAAGLAVAASLFGASGALAQNCTLGPAAPGLSNLAQVGSSPAALGGVIGSSITAASTAFLLQSEAFIGSPPNPGPDQQGGGAWVRGVGGHVDVKTTGSTTVTATGGIAPPGGVSSFVNCTTKVGEDFAGVQFGADVARLNVNGWNLHVGATAGYLSTRGSLSGGLFSFNDPASGALAGGGPFTSTSQVPFAGVYAAATNGGFFVDGLYRVEYYQNNLTAPGMNLSGQEIDAHGWSFSTSMGYNWAVPNSNWFIEPSGTFIVSRVNIDPFTFTTAGTVTPFFTTQIPGTLNFNQIQSDIGRLGLRVGDTIQNGNITWQPFAAVSVWHEFGPNVTGNFMTSPNCCNAVGTGVGSISTIGTFGQYSLGVSASVNNTGWLGFARVDYRDGANLQGVSATGGIRYQFSPEQPTRGVLPVKAPVYKAPIVQAVNWTGFYIGGFGGATLGTADWNFGTGTAKPHLGGFLGGGDIGYNYQTGPWVLGIEGDLAGTNTKGGIACNPGAAAAGPFVVGTAPMSLTTCNASDSWIADITGRIGYSWNRALFYVKGGAAWTNERFTATCNNLSSANTIAFACTDANGAATTGFSANTTRGGWTIGYGTEFALTPNWSARAETDYVSFGDSTVTATNGNVLNVGMHFWEGKIGLNYRFSSAAIATRY